MVVKVREKYGKTIHVRNNDKSKKYNLRGGRNGKYYDRNLSKSREKQKKVILSIYQRFLQKHHWPTF